MNAIPHLTHEQINTLREKFLNDEKPFVVAHPHCSSRLTPGKTYPITDLDGRRLVLREDDGDRIRIGPQSDWNKYFHLPLTAEEKAAFEAAQEALEKRKAYLEAQTTDELIAFITAQRGDLEMATDIVRQRVNSVL